MVRVFFSGGLFRALPLGFLLFLFVTISVEAGDRLPYKFTPPSGWTAVEVPSVDGAWGMISESQLKSKTRSILVHTKKNGRPFQPQGVAAEKLIEIVQKTRGYLLRMSGLSDWTIDHSTLDELPAKKGYRLRMRGHYWGVEDQAVDFVEWAYFIGDRYYQVSFHQPGARPSRSPKKAQQTKLEPLISLEEIEQILSRFIPEGA